MQIDYSALGNSKLTDILRGAERLHERLVSAGDTQGALAVQRLVHSRISANAENRRANREYRETLADLASKDAELAAVVAERDALWKALHDATSIIGHAVPMDTVVLAGEKLVAAEVWRAAHNLLYPEAAKVQP